MSCDPKQCKNEVSVLYSLLVLIETLFAVKYIAYDRKLLIENSKEIRSREPKCLAAAKRCDNKVASSIITKLYGLNYFVTRWPVECIIWHS